MELIIKFEKKKQYLLNYTCIPENVCAYHTVSEFTQHHYVCRVSFIHKPTRIKDEFVIDLYFIKLFHHG